MLSLGLENLNFSVYIYAVNKKIKSIIYTHKRKIQKLLSAKYLRVSCIFNTKTKQDCENYMRIYFW